MRERHYYFSGDFETDAVVIVAIEGGVNDYAAYIGAARTNYSDEMAVEYVHRRGTKISQKWAEFLFPEFKEAGLSWRE
jgi:hypothetical protein